ncbi:MAG: endolytic transglycosylase MltG, partial [Firmicutes bacterium]|nr:endolytic transglycosylase MltG [Bacillota bacterium]
MVHLNQKDPLNGPGKDGFSVRLRMVRAWIQERLAIIVQRSDPVAARGKTWLRAAMSSAAPKPGIGAGSAAARLEAAGRAIALRVTAAFRQVSVWLSVVRTKATKVPAGTLWRAFSPVLESVFRFPGRFILAAWRLAGSRWRATNKLAAFGQGLLTLLLIILAFTGLFVYAQFQPLSEMDIPDQQLLIPPGSSARSIGQILEERGIIRSGLAFLLVAKYQQAESRLVAGEYLLSPSQSPAEILSKMVKGDVIRRETQLTIPEGLTVKEIAGIVEEKLGVPQADFIRTASEGDFGYEYLRGISGGVHHLEGYLFPDTYKLKERSLAPEILGRMLARFDQVFDDRLRERARNMNFTIHQAVTLASIIEKE